ncbi:hypothetical protein B0H10DRAFT_2197960 [Mycena sp. CBHHK59/15]|nr:hypothetical protein B0H10DRAFT_2197960 [Mycena sp. CBHHK59/15]
MSQSYSLLVQRAHGILWTPGLLHHKTPNLYLKISLDGKVVHRTPTVKRELEPEWNDTSTFSSNNTSAILSLRLHHNTAFPSGDIWLAGKDIQIGALLDLCSPEEGKKVVDLELVTSKGKLAGSVSVCLRTINPHEVGKIVVDSGKLTSGLEAVVTKLDIIIRMGDGLTQVVIKQQGTDDKLHKLIQTMVEVYSFVEETEFVSQKIKRLEDTVLAIVKQTAECAIFIQEYTGRGFCAKILDQVEKLGGAYIVLAWNTPGTLAFIIEWLTMPSDNSNFSGFTVLQVLERALYQQQLQSILGAFTVLEHSCILTEIILLEQSNFCHPHNCILASQSNPHIGAAICTAIDQEPTVVMAPIQTQFRKLLLEPLSDKHEHIRGPIIVILDALDECGDAESRAALVLLLSNEPSDSDIANQFRSQSKITGLQLDITTTSNNKDIMTYLCHSMQSIQEQQKKWNLGSDWPGTSRIQILADCSAGLFIWASTACRFINKPNPNDKLEILINHGHNLSNLDKLYAVALQSAGDWDNDKGFSEGAQLVLAALVLGRVPMSERTMDDILQFNNNWSSQLILGCLECLVQWKSGQNAQILHASFGDYLTDPHRSGSHPWFVNRKIQNHALSLGCLQVLNTQLQFNICGLEDSHCRNADVPDLSDCVTTFISPGLSYASCFWATHLKDIDFDPAICREIKNLMQTRFPFWLEVLSLLGQVTVATNALKTARKYTEILNYLG